MRRVVWSVAAPPQAPQNAEGGQRAPEGSTLSFRTVKSLNSPASAAAQRHYIFSGPISSWLSLRSFFRLLAGLAQGVQYRSRSDCGFRLLGFRLRLLINDRLRRGGFGDFNRLLPSRPFQFRRRGLANALMPSFQFRQ